jgi:hypothetical protein
MFVLFMTIVPMTTLMTVMSVMYLTHGLVDCDIRDRDPHHWSNQIIYYQNRHTLLTPHSSHATFAPTPNPISHSTKFTTLSSYPIYHTLPHSLNLPSTTLTIPSFSHIITAPIIIYSSPYTPSHTSTSRITDQLFNTC